MTFFYSCKDKGEKITSNGLRPDAGFCFFQAGDIFEPQITPDQLYISLKNGKDLSSLIGDFSFFFEDESDVYFVNDELGTIKWFYALTEDGLVVSPDFWAVASDLNIDESFIKKDTIYEIILLGVPLSNKTWVEGIFTVPRGSIVKYNKLNNSISIKKYLDINYTESFSGSKEDTFDRIDEALKKTVDALKCHNSSSEVFVSTSGGLDSRFPLPYLSSFENIKSFLIGKKSNFLEPFDFRNARKIVKKFGVDITMVSPESLDVDNKIYLDLSRNPIGQSNILKAVNSRDVLKDKEDVVLVTGSHGGLIGGRVLNEDMLCSVSDDDLVKKIFFYYSIIKKIDYIKSIDGNERKGFFLRKIKTAFRLLNNKVKLSSLSDVDAVEMVDDFVESDYLFPAEGKKAVYSSLKKPVLKDREDGKNNLSVIMNYHLYRHSIRGVFESFLGQVKAYSIYMPYIYMFSKTWPREYLSGRVLMEEFLYERHVELSKIPLQSFKPTIYNRMKGQAPFIKKIAQIFGLGVRRLAIDYDTWWDNKELRKSVDETINKDSYFYSIFNKDDVLQILSGDKYTQLGENLYKYKLMVDAISDGSYKKLVNTERFDINDKY